MINANHTPGPWTVGNHGEAVWQNINEDTDKNICTVLKQDDPSNERGETWANARLIAAAPALLAALKAIAEGGNCDCGAYWKVNNDHMAQARAAIAQAEGGAS